MKLRNILAIALIFFMLMQTVSATDTYNIQDVRNLETTIHIGEVQENHFHSEIDGRNIEEEAPSGGYVGDGKYTLPHDLGLGKHKLDVSITDEWGDEVDKRTYQFYIVKGDEDTSIYDEYAPYYYENDENINDEQLDVDYQDILTSFSFVDDNGGFEEPYEFVNVIISLDLFNVDDSLTSVEIPHSFNV